MPFLLTAKQLIECHTKLLNQFIFYQQAKQGLFHKQATFFLEWKTRCMPWQGGSVGWSVVSCTKILRVPYPVRICLGGNQLMFLSHITVSLSLCLFLSSFLSLWKSINISSGEDLKKIKIWCILGESLGKVISLGALGGVFWHIHRLSSMDFTGRYRWRMTTCALKLGFRRWSGIWGDFRPLPWRVLETLTSLSHVTCQSPALTVLPPLSVECVS